MALSARRAAVAIAAGALVVASASAAHADDTTAARRAAAAREMGLPYTMTELGAGFLTLPAAEVCGTSTTNCSRGEASLSVGIRFLYRYRDWGFGAGIEWATTLRSDAAVGDPSLGREHARSYFLVEGQVRYYLMRRLNWEWWMGGTLGGVVVNDSWSTNADRNPPSDADIEGPRAATLGTEGLAAGIGTGIEWVFLRNLSVGAELRYENWILPTRPPTQPGQPPSGPGVLPTGDVASLSGRVDMLELGIRVAYRIAL